MPEYFPGNMPHGLSPAEAEEAAKNITESGEPRPGYPQLAPGDGGRLFMASDEVRAATINDTLTHGNLTRRITRIHLPAGHDTSSPERAYTFVQPEIARHSLIPIVNDIVTGSDELVPPEIVYDYLEQGYRTFDQHDRPIPGSYERIIQLLSLRTEAGEPVGAAVGNGTFAGPGLHPMSDAVVMSRLLDGDVAILVVGRQHDGVLATIGGFGTRQDLVDGRYSPTAAAVRRTLQETGVDLNGRSTKEVYRDFPVSSPTTINAGLATTAIGAFYAFEPSTIRVERHIPTGADIEDKPYWVRLQDLLELDSKLREKGGQAVWTTHNRYMQAGLFALNHLIEEPA